MKKGNISFESMQSKGLFPEGWGFFLLLFGFPELEFWQVKP